MILIHIDTDNIAILKQVVSPSELTPCKISHICHCSFNGRCICVKWLNQIIFHSCPQAKLFLRFLHSPSRQKKITHSFWQNVFKNLFPSRKKAGKKKMKIRLWKSYVLYFFKNILYINIAAKLSFCMSFFLKISHFYFHPSFCSYTTVI